MRLQSATRVSSPAIATVTRAVDTAAGVFAPGHGGLTRHLPFELVDAVLAETGATERRRRMLPSRVGVYFLLALGLFLGLGYRRVWDKLVAGLGAAAPAAPTAKALRDLRRRVGQAPARSLHEVVAGPLAQPRTPGTRFGRWRTVSFDGCCSIKAPDTAGNLGWLGKARAVRGVTGYPMVAVMTLVETGTRALIGAVFGPVASEIGYAGRLLHLLTPDMLVLADRGFDATEFLERLAATGAQFVIRLTSTRRPPLVARLPDGSHLARIGALTVRIVTVQTTVTCADGTRWTASYRWATTLTDHRHHPATALADLYHQRWEHEVAYLSLRHTLLRGRVLRSGDPIGLRQELWALLTVYQLVRIAMVAAIEQAGGTDPDRAGCTIAVTTAQHLLVNAEHILDDTGDLTGRIGRAVPAEWARPSGPRRAARASVSARSHRRCPAPTRPTPTAPPTAPGSTPSTSGSSRPPGNGP